MSTAEVEVLPPVGCAPGAIAEPEASEPATAAVASAAAPVVSEVSDTWPAAPDLPSPGLPPAIEALVHRSAPGGGADLPDAPAAVPALAQPTEPASALVAPIPLEPPPNAPEASDPPSPSPEPHEAEAKASPAILPDEPVAAPMDAPVVAPATAPLAAPLTEPEAEPAGPKGLPVSVTAAFAAGAALAAEWHKATPRVARGLTGLARLARNRLFMATVAVPTLVSAVYFGLVASDVYVSESKFVVRMPQRQQAPSLMGALMQGSGFMRSQDDAFTVHEYMLSRDALKALDEGRAIHTAFSAAGIDRLNRFPTLWNDDNFESLYRYYGQRVGVSFDAATAITTLRVTAFSSKDAHAINTRLLELSEALVNQVNTRGRNDLIRYAQSEVAQAEKRAKDAATAVAGYRQARAVFDPERQSALQLQGAARLQEELTAARAQLSQVESAAPQNPQLPSLRLRVQQLEAAIGANQAGLTGGSASSLTNKAADYERLVLERGFAERQLAGALSALDAARNEARRQQLYLERVVQPNLPDEATEPRRLRGVAATLVAGLVAWGVLTLLFASVREHRN